MEYEEKECSKCKKLVSVENLDEIQNESICKECQKVKQLN
jgi:hypothetical protein